MFTVGADISNAKDSDAGHILSDVLKEYMQVMGVVNGLKEMGYSAEDVPSLVQGTLPQVTNLISTGIVMILYILLGTSYKIVTPKFHRRSTGKAI